MLPEALQSEPTLQEIESRHGGAILSAFESHGQSVAILDSAHLVSVCLTLKNDLQFNRLSSVTAVDWFPKQPRFEVVYNIHSMLSKRWIRLKLNIAENEPVESVTHIWSTANWYEREVFDLFGIPFNNHPSLDRIMMPSDWVGHPLRKDYPVHGFKYSYSEEQ